MVLLPTPFSDIPRAKLLFDVPSNIEPLSRLTSTLDCGVKFWTKREDCNSGLAFGGNKVRKLEYVLPDAIAEGADTIVTTGGLQSNHMRQTAAAAARLGLKVALISQDLVHTEDAEYHKLGNIQLNGILSAQTFQDKSPDEVLGTLRSQGQKPYFIPSGASTHPLGGLGFARWAFELEEQEESLGVVFDTIVMALASGSTLGGMVAGFECARQQRLKKGLFSKENRRLIGIQATTVSKTEISDLVIQIANTAADKVGLDAAKIDWSQHFELDDRFNAQAYGRLDEATIAGIKELASLEGILADPVYTGKAITGLIAKARAGEFTSSENVLFVHTGGQASLSAYPSLK